MTNTCLLLKQQQQKPAKTKQQQQQQAPPVPQTHTKRHSKVPTKKRRRRTRQSPPKHKRGFHKTKVTQTIERVSLLVEKGEESNFVFHTKIKNQNNIHTRTKATRLK